METKTIRKVEKIIFKARWDARQEYGPQEVQTLLGDFLVVAMRLSVFGRIALVGEYDPHERILRTRISIDYGQGHKGTVIIETDERTFSGEKLFHGYFWDDEEEMWIAEDESHTVLQEYEENIVYKNLWRIAGEMVPAFKKQVADVFNVRL